MSEEKVGRKCFICFKEIKDGEHPAIWNVKEKKLTLVVCSKCWRERSDEVKKLMDDKIWGKPKTKQ